jgi:hypothetical protein
VDAKTGELKMDLTPVDAAPYARAGISVIPIGQEISLSSLAKGAYRLNVQASDAAGKSTPWRTANFIVQ